MRLRENRSIKLLINQWLRRRLTLMNRKYSPENSPPLVVLAITPSSSSSIRIPLVILCKLHSSSSCCKSRRRSWKEALDPHICGSAEIRVASIHLLEAGWWAACGPSFIAVPQCVCVNVCCVGRRGRGVATQASNHRVE